MASKETDAILKFYSGSGPDHRGRYLRDIQSWSDDNLEYVHDYIQWLFPTFERSAFQPNSPVLSPHVVSAFLDDSRLQEQLRTSFRRLLKFYGFSLNCSSEVSVTISDGLQSNSAIWLTATNHNFMRITRILKSLTSLGLRKEAKAFLSSLEALYETSEAARFAIGPGTLQFWRSAV
jgi:hypothetical protein